MAVLFTSDLHLGHARILASRPQFATLEEHDDALIENWNRKVTDKDEVYILGDISFRGEKHISEYLSRMKGRKHLIVGNHDGFWMRHVEDLTAYFDSVDYLKIMKFEKKQITLCHYPLMEWSGSRHVNSGNSFLIHGHIHNTPQKHLFEYMKAYLPHALNAGVDVNHFEPVTFEELKENNRQWYGREENLETSQGGSSDEEES